MTPARHPGRVSIVTPTLDAQAFLRETIASVRGQSYPDIEYIIVDGGSTDATLDIARGLGVTLYVEPGMNQAAAVNFGFERSTGEFVGFLNADDTLLPDAVSAAVAVLRSFPQAPYAYGDAIHIDSEGKELGPYPTSAFSREGLSHECFICQPATLLRAERFFAVGGLDTTLHTAFDYDLWIRMSSSFGSPAKADALWAKSRMHLENKSLRDRGIVYREVLAIISRHYGYVPFNWIHAYAGYLLDGKDYFFDTPAGSPTRTVLTLLLGLRQNSGHRLSFLREFVNEVRRLTRRRGALEA